ncbi:MAG: potassium channel family protein [Kofleriaceae bacterium]
MGKRLLTGFVMLLIVVFGGASGYWIIGDGRWPFFDCLYMTIITLTTVGYGETLEGMDKVEYARAFTVALLVFGTGTLVFFASTITAFIIEGDLKDVLFASRLKKRMKRMKDHIIVCGAGSTGRNVIEELLKTDTPVIAIDVNEAELRDIATKFPKAEFAYIAGDATDDDILAQVNLGAARGLVAALSDDKDNLYLTVSARQVNATCRIVARCAELSHVDKIKRSGADAVVSPNFIGGMRLVSEMLRPAVVRFLDEMVRDKRAAFRIEEILLGDTAAALGATLRAANVRERFGMTVLAVRAKDLTTWIYNPAASSRSDRARRSSSSARPIRSRRCAPRPASTQRDERLAALRANAATRAARNAQPAAATAVATAAQNRGCRSGLGTGDPGSGSNPVSDRLPVPVPALVRLTANVPGSGPVPVPDQASRPLAAARPHTAPPQP